MNNNSWILWGLAAGLATAIWALLLMLPSKKILSDYMIISLYLRLIIIIAAILSIITLFIPKIGLNSENIKVLKDNINIRLLLFSAIYLITYETILASAFSVGGPLVSVPKNMNLIFIIILGMFFLKKKETLDIKMIIAIIGYMLMGGYISWHKIKLSSKV